MTAKRFSLAADEADTREGLETGWAVEAGSIRTSWIGLSRGCHCSALVL
jgi:hypothetical protein